MIDAAFRSEMRMSLVAGRESSHAKIEVIDYPIDLSEVAFILSPPPPGWSRYTLGQRELRRYRRQS